MERFEYCLVEAPKKSSKYKRSSKSDDMFAHTVMDGMNELAREGWQFLRTETMYERRRTGFFIGKPRVHEYMVYRRALRSNGMSFETPINPKRIKRADSPDVQVLHDRISGLMSPDAQKRNAVA